MSLRTVLGMSGEGSLEDGTPDEVMEKKRRANAEKLRPARLKQHAATRSGRRSRTISCGATRDVAAYIESMTFSKSEVPS